jgi:tetratricopeptide (TPR) repeat protein
MSLQLQTILQQAFEYTQKANFIQAKLLFNYILKTQPKNFDALYAMGFISGIENNHQEALHYSLRALKIKPDDPEININCAKALQEIGRHLDSLRHYQRALSLSPNNHNVWLGCGKLLQSLKRYDEAITHYDKALSLNPEYAEAWSNKGDTLNELNRYDEAIAHYDKALSLNPEFAEVWSNKGIALYELKNHDEAITNYDKALSLNPEFAVAWSNKGNALSKLKQYDEAIAHFNEALRLKPDYYEAWFNTGSTLHELKRYDEAIVHYDKALSLRPDYQQAWFYKALLNLFLKKYEAGWENYDWRLYTKDFQLKMVIERLVLWNGSNSKRLLIFSEQGVGDVIFYASILEIAKNKVQSISILVDGRLLPILSRSFPEITFIDENAPLDVSLYDAQIPFGSLPIVLKMNPDMDGRRVPYLIDNDVLTNALKNKLCPKKQLKCGVAWKSNNQKLGKDKSILLSDLNDIFQVDGYEFINLQYGDTREEIEDLENNFGAKLKTIDDIDLFKNIDGLLSIIQMCDFIVTTSNVTAHLAGALGKTTFLLVPYSAGRIWYWHEEVISSWYPSVSLHSQSKSFEWSGAIKDIALKLKNETFK